MRRWLITLVGTDLDLERLVEWQDGKDWEITRHDKWGVVLSGARFEAVDHYEIVSRITETVFPHINRSARQQAPDFQGVGRGKIVEQCQDRNHVIVQVGLAEETDVAGSVSWVKSAPNGAVIDTSDGRARDEKASSFPRLVALQEAHPDLADALTYLEEEPGMSGLYKVGEAILCAIGRPKEWNALVELGWTCDDELWRFTRSIHVKRHHRRGNVQTLMTLDEADYYARGLLNRLIAHLTG